jgi:hypothetical protein
MITEALYIQPAQLENIQFTQKAYSKSLKDLAKSVRRSLKASLYNKNNSKEELEIIFETKRHGLLKIRSQVLMVGSKFMVLRGNKSLPVGSIKQVIN